MPRRKLTDDEKRRRWKAIARAAMTYHELPTERGLGVRIAADAGVKPQSVSEWKNLTTAPDEPQLIKLASVYGVSVSELSGDQGVNESSVEYRPNDEFGRIAMELAGSVTKELLPEGTYDQYMAITQKAMDLIDEGKDEDAAFRALFQFVVKMKESQKQS